MAERSRGNTFQDIILPALAFISAASGPYGAAGASALTNALRVGERRREGERDERRIGEILRQRGEQAEAQREQAEFERGQARERAALERPGREADALEAILRGNALQDVIGQLDAPVPTQEATQALGAPTAERLQTALGRGEQVPLPQEAPGPQVRQERLGQIPTAQLAAAGLSDIAAVRTDPETTAMKEKMLAALRSYPEDLLPAPAREQIAQRVLAADTTDGVLAAGADLPAEPVKPQSARIEEYKFYANHERQQGREPLGPLEYETAQRNASRTRIQSVTNVGPTGTDYGDPPKDTAWARNSDGSVLLEPHGPDGRFAPVAIPIQGGQAYRDIQEAAEKQQLTESQARQSAGIVVDTINRAVSTMEDSILPTTGLIGGLLGNVYGTDAFSLRGQLDTIRANVGFEALQRMRAASPTGGALGQVSDAENRLLQSVLGSLNQGQDNAEIATNLNRIREIYLDVLHGVGRPNRQLEYLTQEDIATLNDAQQQRIEEQTTVTAPDPAQLTVDDLSRMTPEQLDALERRLQQGTP